MNDQSASSRSTIRSDRSHEDARPGADSPEATGAGADLRDRRVVVVGAGSMGGAFVSAMLAAGVAPENLRIVNSSQESSQRAADELGASAGSLDDVAGADAVVLGVKPYQLEAALPSVVERLEPDTVVISLAAGATVETLREHLAGHGPVVRVMPNTPMAVGAGVAHVMADDGLAEEHRDLVRVLLAEAGTVIEQPEEKVHALIGAAGSGVAFMYYIAEAMIDEAVRQGLTRDVATAAVEQTMAGAAALLQSTGMNPAVARAKVCSPGGTTAQGIAALDRAGIRAGLASAMEAAAAKSREMAGE